MYQPTRGAQPIFVSALIQQIEELRQAAAPASGWSNTIRGLVNAGKVKADEVEWSGIEQWLVLQESKVPKAAVLDYLAGNGVRVTEVERSNRAADLRLNARREDSLVRQAEQLQDQGNASLTLAMITRGEPAEHVYNQSLRDIAKLPLDFAMGVAEWHEGLTIPPEERVPKYGERYTLPGGSNYTELLLTLPVRNNGPALVAKSAATELFERDMMLKYGGGAFSAAYSRLSSSEVDRYEMLVREDRNSIRSTEMIAERAVTYRSAHWHGTPNVLAPVRLNERVDTDGKKVLFIEEIQSDWAQEGKRKGIRPSPSELGRLEPGSPETVMALGRGDFGPMHVDVDDGFGREAQLRLEAGHTPQSQTDDRVPAAPFVGKTEAWLGLALRRIVKYAADHGFERVALINGDQSADRYDLSKTIDRIEARRVATGFYLVKAFDKVRGVAIVVDEYRAEQLPDMLGKDVAAKVIDAAEVAAAKPPFTSLPDGFFVSMDQHSFPGQPYTVIPPGQQHGRPYSGWHETEELAVAAAVARLNAAQDAVGVVRGLDLRVGGEGMRTFYDTLVPSVAKGVLRKLGGNGLREIHFGGANDDGKFAVIDSATGDTVFRTDLKRDADEYLHVYMGEATIKELDGQDHSRASLITQIGFDITPAMRLKVETGVPLFRRAADAGKMTPDEVAAAASSVTARWERIPEVVVLKTFDDAPASVRRYNADRLAAGAESPSAFVHDGKAYLVADRMTSDQDVAESLFHEAVGHWGLRGTFGSNLGPLLDDLAARNPGRVRAAARASGLSVDDPADLRLAAEELLASLAENAPKVGWGRRAVVAVKGWLRNHVDRFKDWEYTDDELVLRFIAPTKRYVEGGHAEPLTHKLLGRFSASFRRWFGNSKVTDAHGEPLVVYHGTSDADGFDDGAFSYEAKGVNSYGDADIGFFFSGPGVASHFATSDRAAVFPVYLNLQAPKVVQGADYVGMLDSFSYDDWQAFKRAAEGAGHDGLVVRTDNVAQASEYGQQFLQDNYIAFQPEQIKSALGNGGNFDPHDPRIAFQRGRPIFASELAQHVSQAPMNRASPESWCQYFDALAKRGRIKADEVEWSGLADWLSMHQGKVDKVSVLEYVHFNGVRVHEAMLDDRPPPLPAEWTVHRNEERSFSVLDHNGVEISEGESEADAIENAQDPDATSPTATKYNKHKYVLPGGANYRELVLHLPSRDLPTAPQRKQWAAFSGDEIVAVSPTNDHVSAWSDNGWRVEERLVPDKQAHQRVLERLGNYRSGHWDQINVLAHVRLTDRVDAEGRSVLFVEEIQSDWAQEGKRKGFSAPVREDEALVARRMGASVAWEVRTASGRFVTNVTPTEVIGDDTFGTDRYRGITSEEAIAEAQHRIREEPQRTGRVHEVPAGPFLDATPKWVALAVKRVIKLAVDEGYDRVAFISGDESADRYDLARHIKQIRYIKHSDDTWDVWVPGSDWSPELDKQRIKRSVIADFVGKDVAEQILAGRGTSEDGEWVLEGVALKMGGSGMRAFYDRIVPSVARDVLKRLGGPNLSSVDIPGTELDSKHVGFDITEALRSRASEAVPLFRRRRPAPTMVENDRQAGYVTEPHFDNNTSALEP